MTIFSPQVSSLLSSVSGFYTKFREEFSCETVSRRGLSEICFMHYMAECRKKQNICHHS